MSELHIYPTFCLVCGAPVFDKSIYCTECRKYAPELKRVCKRCGSFTPLKQDDYCYFCKDIKIYFDSIVSPYIYCGSTSIVIKKMKYTPVYNYSLVIGNYLPEIIAKNSDYDLVLYTPMHWIDKLRRSFNQAEIFAESFSRKWKIPLGKSLLKKVRKTPNQAELDFKERTENLKDAFSVNEKKVKHRKILLIDDVATTLTTINTISKLLKKSDATSVSVITMARTTTYFSHDTPYSCDDENV